MKTSFQAMPVIEQPGRHWIQLTDVVIWFSRHPMTAEQVSSLPNSLILHFNPTFGLDEQEAIREMVKLAEEKRAEKILGVFPGSLLVEMVNYRDRAVSFGVAIAAPQFAEDGTQRGFQHTGWKMF